MLSKNMVINIEGKHIDHLRYVHDVERQNAHNVKSTQ